MYPPLQSCLFLPCATACTKPTDTFVFWVCMGNCAWKQIWLWKSACLLGRAFHQPGRSLDLVHDGVAPQTHTGATQRLVCRRGPHSWEEGQDDCSHHSATVKAKLVELQLGLLVINTTFPAASNPLFDAFDSPQGDYDLHFEKHCCSTTKLRGEVHWQYAAVNLG